MNCLASLPTLYPLISRGARERFHARVEHATIHAFPILFVLFCTVNTSTMNQNARFLAKHSYCCALGPPNSLAGNLRAARIIDLRRVCPGSVYACSMSPGCAKQADLALKMIMGEDGTTKGREKIMHLRRNANMFRRGLERMGCEVLGDDDSPVVPVMLYNPSKIPAFSRACLDRRLAVVVVGFPATPLIKSRVR